MPGGGGGTKSGRVLLDVSQAMVGEVRGTWGGKVVNVKWLKDSKWPKTHSGNFFFEYLPKLPTFPF